MKSAEEDSSIAIFCDCCGTRVMWIQGDCLVIRQKHHQDKHTTVLPIESLLKLSKLSQTRQLVKSML